ncbi:MAG: hypothetical protein WD448_00675 [Woeseia sp.]
MGYRATMMHITSRLIPRRRRCGRLLPVLAAAFTSLVFSLDAAAQARLFVHPTLVMLSNTHRSESVHIVNQGNATGVFELAWVDFAMTPQGGLSPWDGKAPWSLQPFARFSPRRVTLRPGETQLVRLALRAPGDAAGGEYYSHLRVVTLNDDLDAATAANEANKRETVTIDARTAIAVPVIWRNSAAEPRATIESVEFHSARKELIVDLRRSGELSTRGYLHVLGAAGRGMESRPLADPVPVVIYPSAEQRIVTVPLKATEVDLSAGAEVIYASDIEITSTTVRYAIYSIRR